MDEAEAAEALKPFLQNNPKSSIKKIPTAAGAEAIGIANPWGDPSIGIEIGKNAEQLIPALNSVILPERLSAIYHIGKKQLEILWTAYRLSPNTAEVAGRQFIFRYNGDEHKCRFDKSSAELLAIAPNYQPLGPSDINYRNLGSFDSYVSSNASGVSTGTRFGEPMCFFIDGVDYSEDELVPFLMSLNFYMSYYDALTPRVLIHPPQTPKSLDASAIRYRHKTFPKNISAKILDSELLQFWTACLTSEPARQFLYAYRIIEHAAFFFVESAPRLAVRKALMMPHALDDIASTADRVLAAVRTSRIDEYTRLETLVLQSVDPSVLWPVVKKNIEAFSKPERFDGGFELPALVANEQSEADFLNSGLRIFCNHARRIRNALSHGREEKNATVIMPTNENYDKLRPWSALMVRTAGEIILYEHA